MKKYLFIDTNIYIQCCLLELEGDNLDTLNDLEKLLEKNKVKLLLPEVVELEFYKRIEEKMEELKNKIGSYKESINKGDLDKKIKKDLIKKLGECMKDREKNTEKVKKKMEEIFENKKFTIKKNLEINENNLINSYKTFLSGKKPYKKEGKGEIQPDCLIIETLVSFFNGIRKYDLFFCSSNKKDFAQHQGDKKDLIIHSEVAKRFKNIKYYENLFELLNAEFGGQYSEESIKELNEKEADIFYTKSPSIDALASIRGTESPTRLGGLADYYKECRASFADVNNGIIPNSAAMRTGKDSLSLFDASCAIPEDSFHHASFRLMPLKRCKKCGESYEIGENRLVDDGLCDKCRNKGLM
ncbi:MAG: PIN domain-containing protein [Parcubacteria group bacterium]|jgi:hypothetical protein